MRGQPRKWESQKDLRRPFWSFFGGNKKMNKNHLWRANEMNTQLFVKRYSFIVINFILCETTTKKKMFNHAAAIGADIGRNRLDALLNMEKFLQQNRIL